ncbi:DNA-binding protein [Lachnospiraceae bacterium]|jgi:sugar-specific transcriptional regulator TrmB|nr:DNA-binding protein [Lachnospiraceae bacterium]
MKNSNRMYLTAEEVAEILGVSKAYAYKVIRNLNDELEIKGYVVISGKVSTKYFREKFYGFEIALQKEETE